MELRYYQQDAKAAIYEALRTRDDNPCAVLPTAAGKTPMLTSICIDATSMWNGRVNVISHVQELVSQAARTLGQWAPSLDVGVYSAGLKRRDCNQPVIVSGIQSVWRKAPDVGPFDLVIVDEAHLINFEDDGMYRSYLHDLKVMNPLTRVVGLTATPYRLKEGPICSPEGVLNHICYEVGVLELIEKDYLSKLVSKGCKSQPDLSNVKVRGGEFCAGELEMETDLVVEAACVELLTLAQDRRSILVFAAGIMHGEHVCEILQEITGAPVGFIHGKTSTAERDRLIDAFKSGSLRILVNVNVLTTGFDAPNIDCVALMRATLSPGLYYQMVGRGFRKQPSKRDCLILDFGGNIVRHGPVDQIKIKPRKRGEAPAAAPVKACPQCLDFIPAGCVVCPVCNYVFPPPEKPPHDSQASKLGVLSTSVATEWRVVQDARYSLHEKGGKTPSMKVEYQVGLEEYYSEWICFQHDDGTFARNKAVGWWRKRSSRPVPESVAEALELVEDGEVMTSSEIQIKYDPGSKFPEIVNHKLGPMNPDGAAPKRLADHWEDDEIPF